MPFAKEARGFHLGSLSIFIEENTLGVSTFLRMLRLRTV
jgi:hypothetical protein